MSENLKYLKKEYKEIKKEDVLKFEPGRVYIIYNPLTDSFNENIASSKDIVHSKYCYDKLKYFVKGE